MKVTFHIPDEVAAHLGGEHDLTRRALEALALDGYRGRALSLLQVSQMLDLSRVQTEDFLGAHQIALAPIDEHELNREAAQFDAVSHSTHP